MLTHFHGFLAHFRLPTSGENIHSYVLFCPGPIYIASALALVSAAIIYVFIPDITPDYMERENVAFKLYLEEHGFDTSLMGEAQLIVDPEDAPESKGGEFNQKNLELAGAGVGGKRYLKDEDGEDVVVHVVPSGVAGAK